MTKKKELPVLNPFFARSTHAMFLTAITTISAAFNVDIFGHLGTTEDGLLDVVDALLPIASGIWLWWERHNPSYRLGFK